MKMTGNTMLITGGGPGTGAALAQRFNDLGNSVIVAGRRREALDAVIAGRANMAAMTFGVEDGGAVADFASRLVTEHPAVNILFNNAGIMRTEAIGAKRDLADAEASQRFDATFQTLNDFARTAREVSH